MRYIAAFLKIIIWNLRQSRFLYYNMHAYVQFPMGMFLNATKTSTFWPQFLDLCGSLYCERLKRRRRHCEKNCFFSSNQELLFVSLDNFVKYFYCWRKGTIIDLLQDFPNIEIYSHSFEFITNKVYSKLNSSTISAFFRLFGFHAR